MQESHTNTQNLTSAGDLESSLVPRVSRQIGWFRKWSPTRSPVYTDDSSLYLMSYSPSLVIRIIPEQGDAVDWTVHRGAISFRDVLV